MRHPDEGQIHAWLDGALDPATAAELDAHLAACPACSAAVAEARGLIAGASRILLALDNVPAGVIPTAPRAPEAVPSDAISAHRTRQHADSMASPRRSVPWYARRSVQIAASLLLVVGIGSVAVRSSGKPDELFIQFETDAAPATRGPAAGSAAPVIAAPSAVAASANDVAATNPPADRLSSRVASPAPAPAAPATPRSELGGVSAERSLGKAATARTREGVAEQRGAQVATAEVPVAAASSPTSTPPTGPLPAAAAGASAAFGATANAPTRAMMDTVGNSLARSLTDMAASRRTSSSAQGTIAGKVIASDDSPIALATVSVPSVNVAVQTGADGSFTLPPLAPGRYTLEARRIGYSSARLEGLEIIGGDTAYARLAMKASTSQLSGVVVTGAATGVSNIGGACVTLNVAPDSESRGIPLLPRRVRFRLADRSSSAAADAASPGPLSQARAPAPSRADAGTPSEPAAPLAWEPTSTSSIEVTWPIAGDVVTMRLEVRGSTVVGIAQGQSFPLRTAAVEGRTVACTTR